MMFHFAIDGACQHRTENDQHDDGQSHSVVKSDPCFTGGPLPPFWGRRLDFSSGGSSQKMTHSHHSRPCVDQNNITGALEVDFETKEGAFN